MEMNQGSSEYPAGDPARHASKPPLLTLGIDTSSRNASVALLRADTLTATRVLSFDLMHSESLMAGIREVLAESEATLRDLGLVSVVSGPGSFTGLRIGLGTVMGISWALNIPVVGLSSLDVLAECAREEAGERTVATVLDAQRGEVFFREYFPDADGLQSMSDSEVILPGLEIPDHMTGPAVFIGDALDRWRDTWSAALGAHFSEANPEVLARRGEMAARLGRRRFGHGAVHTAAELRPHYVRLPAPVEKRQEEEKA